VNGLKRGIRVAGSRASEAGGGKKVEQEDLAIFDVHLGQTFSSTLSLVLGTLLVVIGARPNDVPAIRSRWAVEPLNPNELGLRV
jgi:hypothetical protein